MSHENGAPEGTDNAPVAAKPSSSSSSSNTEFQITGKWPNAVFQKTVMLLRKSRNTRKDALVATFERAHRARHGELATSVPFVLGEYIDLQEFAALFSLKCLNWPTNGARIRRLVDSVWQRRSCISGELAQHTAKPCETTLRLVKWDPSKHLTLGNIVVMTVSEAIEYRKLIKANDERPPLSPEAMAHVAARAALAADDERAAALNDYTAPTIDFIPLAETGLMPISGLALPADENVVGRHLTKKASSSSSSSSSSPSSRKTVGTGKKAKAVVHIDSESGIMDFGSIDVMEMLRTQTRERAALKRAHADDSQTIRRGDAATSRDDNDSETDDSDYEGAFGDDDDVDADLQGFTVPDDDDVILDSDQSDDDDDDDGDDDDNNDAVSDSSDDDDDDDDDDDVITRPSTKRRRVSASRGLAALRASIDAAFTRFERNFIVLPRTLAPHQARDFLADSELGTALRHVLAASLS